jgi:hypothetical protein
MAAPLLLPLISVGLQAAGSIFSFGQAKKQRDKEREAQREAAKALGQARRELSVNALAGLSIAKEPYELEREAMLQAGASALQAGVEGDPRGAAATAGRVLQAQQAGQAQQRAAMSQEMQRLDELSAREESRLQGARANLDLAEARGQQQMAAEARQAGLAATQAGIQQAIGAGTTLAGQAKLFGNKSTVPPNAQFDKFINPNMDLSLTGQPTTLFNQPLPEVPNLFGSSSSGFDAIMSNSSGLNAPIFPQGISAIDYFQSLRQQGQL